MLCHIVFCWPVICDVNANQFKKLVHLDRIARRWASVSANVPSLQNMLDKSCVKLIRKIARDKETHPLADFFITRNQKTGIRHTRQLLPLRRRSAMYNSSFVKYSVHS